MFPFSVTPTMILGIALAISLAGNAWLFSSRDAAMEAKATAETAYEGAMGAANLCSASVNGLAADSQKRHEDIVRRLASQAGKVRDLEQASIEALQARPSDPSDLCASLDAFLSTEIVKEHLKRKGVRP